MRMGVLFFMNIQRYLFFISEVSWRSSNIGNITHAQNKSKVCYDIPMYILVCAKCKRNFTRRVKRKFCGTVCAGSNNKLIHSTSLVMSRKKT